MGSLKITIIVLITSLAFFHLAMLVLGKNRRFWFMTDYIWLSIAILGVIGATGEARKLKSAAEIWIPEVEFKTSVESLRHRVKSEFLINKRQEAFSVNWEKTKVMNNRAKLVKEATAWF